MGAAKYGVVCARLLVALNSCCSYSRELIKGAQFQVPRLSRANTLSHPPCRLLKFLPDDEVAIGVWLLSVDLRRVNHPRFVECGQQAVTACLGLGTGASSAGARPRGQLLGPAESAAGDWLDRHCDTAPIVVHPAAGTTDARLLAGPGADCAYARRLQAAATSTALRRALASAHKEGASGISEAPVSALEPDTSWHSTTGAPSSRPWAADGERLLAVRWRASTDASNVGASALGYYRRDPGARSSQPWAWESLDTLTPGLDPSAVVLSWRGALGKQVVYSDACAAGGSASKENDSAATGPSVPGPSGAAAASPQRPAANLCTVVYDLASQRRHAALPGRLLAVARCGRWALLHDPVRGIVLADLATHRRWPVLGRERLPQCSKILRAEFSPDSSSALVLLPGCASAPTQAILLPVEDAASTKPAAAVKLPLPGTAALVSVTFLTRSGG